MLKRLPDVRNIKDLRQAARRRAHRMVFDYIDGGADDEKCIARNASAFDDYTLAHRVLTGCEQPDLSIELLGRRLDVPFLLSPAAGNRLFHTDGEYGPAEAAAKHGTVYCLSTLSSRSIEEIAQHTDGPKWFQLYVWKDRALVREMLARARSAGFEALILTVDFPITGNRERDLANGFTIPPKIGVRQVAHALMAPFWVADYLRGPPITYANLNRDVAATSLNAFVADQLTASFSWDDAAWLLEEWGGPALLKGIARADDAVRAKELGYAGAFLSNHGGRQLDASPAPLHTLPSVRRAVGEDWTLIVDGGIRRGTDVLKALALGANAVSFARPYLYGLAAYGRKGAVRACDLVAEAIKRDAMLCGVESVASLSDPDSNPLTKATEAL